MPRKIIICKNCGFKKPHGALNLCIKCYKKQNLKVCKNCGKLKPHHAKGLCSNCYKKQNLIICKICGELKENYSKKICTNCYNHKFKKNQPMFENKNCSQYLGVHIAEKLLSKVFKNVKQMPYGNKGFDFKCSKGKKIDVKSSCLHFDKNYLNHKGGWNFAINKNTIADYFLCIAFDNRTDKNPQHLWLIPAEKINHLQTLKISKTQTYKWFQYEKSLEKTIFCCNKLKGEFNDSK